MTTSPTTIRGQRRYYTYEPLLLDPVAVWRELSHCQYAASQTLHDIRVTWDRGKDALTMTFANSRGEQFESSWSVSVDDPAAITRLALNQAEWTIESTLVRVSDQRTMDNDEVFGTVDGRMVMVEDMWPALYALCACVCAHSERIRDLRDPQEPLFWNNLHATADAAYHDLPGAIVAEKRVLTYADYLLNLDGFDINLSPRERAAFALMADIHITWEENGDPSTEITFIAPNEFGYVGEVIPVWEQEVGSEACWHVEIHSNQTTKQMKRADVYHTLPDGEKVTFEEITSVMVVLHQFLTQCEDDGYPAFDEQIV